MKLKGKISIGRLYGGGEPEVIVQIIDDATRVHFVEGRLSLLEFAQVITGQGEVPIELEVRGLDLLGKRREHKTAFVPFDSKYIPDETKRQKAIDKALKPFEIDGWKARREDMENHHRYERDRGVDGYRVNFVRFV
jgi:hypothetical protein